MIEVGMKNEKTIEVTNTNTAAAMASGALNVFATPAMIALMEEVAFNLMAPHLEEGQGSVGTAVAVSHVSASPVGATIRCEAVVTKVDGRRVCFDVKAYDNAGLIGEGTHERFIIFDEKFMAKANAKLD